MKKLKDIIDAILFYIVMAHVCGWMIVLCPILFCSIVFGGMVLIAFEYIERGYNKIKGKCKHGTKNVF